MFLSWITIIKENENLPQMEYFYFMIFFFPNELNANYKPI